MGGDHILHIFGHIGYIEKGGSIAKWRVYCKMVYIILDILVTFCISDIFCIFAYYAYSTYFLFLALFISNQSCFLFLALCIFNQSYAYQSYFVYFAYYAYSTYSLFSALCIFIMHIQHISYFWQVTLEMLWTYKRR